MAVGLASSVMFVRMLVEVGIVRNALVPHLLPTLGAMLVVGFGGCAFLWWKARGLASGDDGPQFANPFSLKQALRLGLVFAAVRLVAAFMHERFGDVGLHAAALLAGLSDVDAITVSVSRMHAAGLSDSTAVTAIALAAVGNTLVKTGIALAVGGREVGLRVASVLLPAAAVGIAVSLLA